MHRVDNATATIADYTATGDTSIGSPIITNLSVLTTNLNVGDYVITTAGFPGDANTRHLVVAVGAFDCTVDIDADSNETGASVANTANMFRNALVSPAISATVVDADERNVVQEEIVSVVLASGQGLNVADNEQLKKAVVLKIGDTMSGPLRILDGSVGATVDPDANDFIIESTTPCGMTFLTDNNQSNYINFGNDVTDVLGSIEFTHGSGGTSGDWSFLLSGVEVLNIATTGIRPKVGSSILLGAATARWSNLYTDSINADGFSTLGAGALPVKFKLVSGATGATEGSETTVDLGVDVIKISNAAIFVVASGTELMPPHHTTIPGYEFDWRLSKIGAQHLAVVNLHATNSENILLKPFRVGFFYTA